MCIKHGAKVKRCSSEGCNNQAKKGGVCIKHGAKYIRKRCSSEGCKNIAVKGGVCRRHGAYRNPNDKSTAFASLLGPEFDKTTTTRIAKKLIGRSTKSHALLMDAQTNHTERRSVH